MKKYLLIIPLLITLLLPAVVGAAPKDIICDQLGKTGSGDTSCPEGDSTALVNSAAGRIINGLIFFAGAVAVIIIIVAGLMYILSTGDPQNTQRAKDTILYAVIGLVVALAARLIVNFVLTRIG